MASGEEWVKLRAWWSHVQGLDGSIEGEAPAEAFRRSGWARSVGGVTPYLTVHARTGGTRERIEKAANDLELFELPAARGCTYVTPSEDFALALTVSRGFTEETTLKMAVKHLGVTREEIYRLAEKVTEALADGPLDPAELKNKLGDAVRNLGEEGKKRGTTTTLPMCLIRLQSQGVIRRQTVDGRLETQRYRYVLWKPNPLERTDVTQENAYARLADHYFKWIGPAKLDQFAWFAGISGKAARAAIETLELTDLGGGQLLPTTRLKDFEAFKVPDKPDYRLVGSIDGIMHHRRDVISLIEDQDLDRVQTGDRGPVAIGQVEEIFHHVIVDRGRIVGMWDYDPEAKKIEYNSFVGTPKELAEAIERTETFVRDELEDARSFSLDSPQSRRKRLEGLRSRATA